MAIYNQTEKEVLKQLSSSLDGLSNEEVKKRQEQYGLNQMNQSKPKSPVAVSYTHLTLPTILLV